jgi:hypothetical protein
MLRWFDPSQAVLIPSGDRPIWLAEGEAAPHPLLASYLAHEEAKSHVVGNGVRLYQVATYPTPVPPGVRFMNSSGNAIDFVNAPFVSQDADTLTILTFWQQMGQPRPTKIFIHLLDEAGQLVAQWDGLGAAWEGWREGDVLAQVSELPIAGVPAGQYRLVAGLYDPESLQRRQSTEGQEFVELGQVTLP